jgi:DNA-binding transcriptional ArsR family regulator
VGVPEEAWYDADAGPVVRPYAMTGGRTQPDRSEFDLITVVWGTSSGAATKARLSPEQSTIVDLCRDPTSVTEIAAHLKLPLGTVRVLLSDLRDAGLITVPARHEPTDEPSVGTLERVLNGLLAL